LATSAERRQELAKALRAILSHADIGHLTDVGSKLFAEKIKAEIGLVQKAGR